MFSWPVTSAIMVPAFGSLVAAALPLLLTLAGLVASADGLVLLNQAPMGEIEHPWIPQGVCWTKEEQEGVTWSATRPR